MSDHPLDSVLEKVRACMQCGTCTGSCLNSHAMDLAPRELWRLVQLQMTDEILASNTFWLCAGCYMCTLRCPRGLPLTEAMGELKRLAPPGGVEKKSPLFYRTFMDVVRRYGRVREMELMARYFLGLKSPVTPLGFTPLGIRLLRKGKLSPRWPSFGEARLEALFRKVEEMEARP